MWTTLAAILLFVTYGEPFFPFVAPEIVMPHPPVNSSHSNLSLAIFFDDHDDEYYIRLLGGQVQLRSGVDEKRLVGLMKSMFPSQLQQDKEDRRPSVELIVDPLIRRSFSGVNDSLLTTERRPLEQDDDVELVWFLADVVDRTLYAVNKSSGPGHGSNDFKPTEVKRNGSCPLNWADEQELMNCKLLEAAKVRAESKVNGLEVQLGRCREQQENSTRQNHDLQARLEDKTFEHSQLVIQLNQVNACLAEETEKANSLQEAVKNNQQLQFGFEEALRAKTEELSRKTKFIAELEKAAEQARSRVKILEEENNRLQIEITDKTGRLGACESRRFYCEQELVRVRNNFTLCTEQQLSLEANLLMEHDKVVRQLYDQLDQENKDCDRAVKDKQVLMKKKEELIKAANEAQVRAESKVGDLEVQLGRYKTQQEEYVRQSHDLKARLDEETQERNKLSTKLNSLQSELNNVNERLDEEIGEANSIRLQLNKANINTQQLQSRIIRFEGELSAKKKELEEFRNAKYAADEAERYAEKLGEENSRLKDEIGHMNEQLEKFEISGRRREQDFNKVKNELDVSIEQWKTSEARYEQAVRELSYERDKANKYHDDREKEEMRVLTNKNDELIKAANKAKFDALLEVDGLKTRLRHYEMQLEEATRQNRDLEAGLNKEKLELQHKVKRLETKNYDLTNAGTQLQAQLNSAMNARLIDNTQELGNRYDELINVNARLKTKANAGEDLYWQSRGAIKTYKRRTMKRNFRNWYS